MTSAGSAPNGVAERLPSCSVSAPQDPYQAQDPYQQSSGQYYPATPAPQPTYGDKAYSGYPDPGYPNYVPYPQRKTNGLSVAALVCGIIPFFILPVLGIIFGAIALNQIKRSGEDGRGMALAGLIVGCVWVSIFLLVFLLPLLFVGSAPFWVR